MRVRRPNRGSGGRGRAVVVGGSLDFEYGELLRERAVEEKGCKGRGFLRGDQSRTISRVGVD